MDFIALDVETANADPGSICQIGIAVFKGGELIETWETLINPQTHFDWMNTQIHGIQAEDVKEAPLISQIKSKLDKMVKGNVVCTYSNFDKVAIEKNFGPLNYDWLDITRIVRRTWGDVAYKGYGLANVCRLNNIELIRHHDALADAIAAGQILVCALNHRNITIRDCEALMRKRISTLIACGEMSDGVNPENIIIDGGNPNGEWFGDVLCFTGELKMSRIQASITASQLGFDVGKSVTRKTNYLVKGQQDLSKLNGKSISSKEEKALGLIRKGQDIVIIAEDDFFYMIGG